MIKIGPNDYQRVSWMAMANNEKDLHKDGVSLLLRLWKKKLVEPFPMREPNEHDGNPDSENPG